MCQIEGRCPIFVVEVFISLRFHVSCYQIHIKLSLRHAFVNCLTHKKTEPAISAIKKKTNHGARKTSSWSASQALDLASKICHDAGDRLRVLFNNNIKKVFGRYNKNLDYIATQTLK